MERSLQHSSASSSADSAVVRNSALPLSWYLGVFMQNTLTTRFNSDFYHVNDGEKEFHALTDRLKGFSHVICDG